MLRRQRDFRLEKHHCETPTGVSLTVPDESYSIREILEKFTTGIDLRQQLARQPQYDSGASLDSEDLEKVQHLDLYEQQEQLENLKIFQEKYKEQKSPVASQLDEGDKSTPRKVEAKKTDAKTDDAGSSKADVE